MDCQYGAKKSVITDGIVDDNYDDAHIIQKIRKRINSGDKFYSLEFFPPRTDSGGVNLIARFDRLAIGNPLFIDVTWHPKGNSGGDEVTASLTIASAALNFCGLDSMLHMTCINSTTEDIDKYLRKAKKQGLRNILALRGDVSDSIDESVRHTKELKYASDLVKHIRKEFGNYFGIAVAGYPDGHPECSSYEDDIRRLKEKLDNGGDFVVTQLFFDAETYFKFLRDCRNAGITAPIIPGILPIQGYNSLRHLVQLSKLPVPQRILDTIESIKDNDEAIRKFGIVEATNLCKKLLASDDVPGIHVYTLNREEAVVKLLKRVGLWHEESIYKSLPWRPSANGKRISEDVRPIFWASRPKSYVHRTMMWDEYPNGRWGSSASPAFGELKDYHIFYLKNTSKKDELLKMWGEKLESVEDVYEIFTCFVSGERNKYGYKVDALPWSNDALALETLFIKKSLEYINSKGILTINSQPNVNALPSTHEVFGWGGPNGYVYQKAYLEFFISAERFKTLLEVLPNFPMINYHALDLSESINVSNSDHHQPIAVTWGVFPGREILQPTVVDPTSFSYWKDEAFALWTNQWANLYPEESKSRQVITAAVRNFVLVNMVDNDFIQGGNLWKVLDQLFSLEADKAVY
ncbi:uncharacterized protein TRIADDRAFT_26971 [Trichoplax adhaerens]|uniref:methylenetetrahydrofolate reductase (NADPH) n=1 Tax=Trichoplax adhaerens TaxID=10228 RepID=B3S098_TRIAD|nr:hypothetical protein TRIADDRAFT_26971 [Trichoplax adhaerens]EDV24348.1 hypothetical protein TRIADDRAFT_26971 [Trichoplax adhaerens]|eukprot:XP_002113874.1 hypothetical protein TRIADDRAFT_26971 [Trichoplax adhaerens]